MPGSRSEIIYFFCCNQCGVQVTREIAISCANLRVFWLITNKIKVELALVARSMQMTNPSKIGTYAISLLIKAINDAGKSLNLMNVWNIQSLPENLESLLIKISKEVHTWENDNSRSVENVDSYLKSERFWELIQCGEFLITNIDN